MARGAISVLLALALFNIAHADLLKPCQCGPQNPMSCGQCFASRGAEQDARAPC